MTPSMAVEALEGTGDEGAPFLVSRKGHSFLSLLMDARTIFWEKTGKPPRMVVVSHELYDRLNEEAKITPPSGQGVFRWRQCAQHNTLRLFTFMGMGILLKSPQRFEEFYMLSREEYEEIKGTMPQDVMELYEEALDGWRKHETESPDNHS